MIFLIVCGISAFIGWLSGYNFDHRSEYVGLWAAITMMIAFTSCMIGEEFKHIGEVNLLPQPPYFHGTDKS